MNSLPISAFLAKAKTQPVIDVRSPAEYAHAHLPGAFNIPLFDNEERAKVGTCYKQVGKEAAILLGLEMVGPKLAGFVHQARALGNSVLVHCWRGGMRSGSMAWLLQTAGLEVATLQGGYKAYRQEVLLAFEKPYELQILGGKTGSGKTDLLKELAKNNYQVLDLEAIAHHKGSSFGRLGQQPQPSSEMFENVLYEHLQTLDITKPIWVEDESKAIGRVQIPLAFWQQMCQAVLYCLEVPVEERVRYLVEQYGYFSAPDLQESLDRIARRLGGQHHKAATEALARGNYAEVVRITMVYYDKAYQYGIEKRANVRYIEGMSTHAPENLKLLVK